MAIFTAGPTSSFPTIADAMLAAGPADTIELEIGYSNGSAASGATLFAQLAPGLALTNADFLIV